MDFIKKLFSLASKYKRVCIPESFNTNITQVFGLQNNLCEFTTLDNKFKLKTGFKQMF